MMTRDELLLIRDLLMTSFYEANRSYKDALYAVNRELNLKELELRIPKLDSDYKKYGE